MKEEESLVQALRHLPAREHAAWISEVQRLRQIVTQYLALAPRRTWQPLTQQYEYVPAVQELCQAAHCCQPIIVAREPHRALAPSPHSLDRWARAYRREGAVALLRQRPAQSPGAEDARRAPVSAAAAAWLETHWREIPSPRALYEEWKKVAAEQGWTIPSESWLYRRWQQIPVVVKTVQRQGWQAWESRYAPYVPRNYSDLQALQILCGDHSERDVLVNDGGKLRRPWLTLWMDLRTGLLWGWYLGRVPCAESVALAYADGLLKYGAQPVARPAENFYSYIYTDWGRDYRSHSWDGQVIAVHQAAMQPTSGLELFLTEKRVGILEELMIRHLTARRYNAKEKPVERVFRDVSEWEKNRFAEYCGANARGAPRATPAISSATSSRGKRAAACLFPHHLDGVCYGVGGLPEGME